MKKIINFFKKSLDTHSNYFVYSYMNNERKI